MGHTLEQFAAECHRILKANPGPTGRQQVCTLLQEVLQEESFVTTHLGDDVPERKILYEDAELGFCILAHVHHDARTSPPHDHGPSWAIYGQARGETEMTDWELIEPASENTPGKVRPVMDKVFPFRQAAEAHARMESSVHIGKIVLAM